MALADKARAFRFAMITTIGSVLGGVLGYYIGLAFFDLVGRAIVEFYGLSSQIEVAKETYHKYGAEIVFVAGFTPIPYKVFTIASGLVSLSLPVFIIASVISRGARFFLIAGLLYWFGPMIRAFIERYLGALTIAFSVLLVGGFIALKYIFV